MKKIAEVICCVLHAIAVVMIWLTLPFKDEPKGVIPKLAWAAVIVPFVPFLYVFTGHDFL